jgi:CD36 family
MQFNPLLEKKDEIWVFVNDLSRCGSFDYDRTDDTYPHLKNLIYVLSESLMYNQTRNPDNANYFGYVDGTSNLTTTIKAPGFVSKGHFYQISPEVASSVPVIVNLQGIPIVPDADQDDTYLGVEQISGANMVAMERIQNNFQIFNDALFWI